MCWFDACLNCLCYLLIVLVCIGWRAVVGCLVYFVAFGVWWFG